MVQPLQTSGQRIVMKGDIAGGFFYGGNLMWHSSASAANKGTGTVVYVRALGPSPMHTDHSIVYLRATKSM